MNSLNDKEAILMPLTAKGENSTQRTPLEVMSDGFLGENATRMSPPVLLLKNQGAAKSLLVQDDGKWCGDPRPDLRLLWCGFRYFGRAPH